MTQQLTLDSLLPAEVERLGELEGIIERGLETFVDVGLALLEIRGARLYRESHATFDAYCRQRWGFARSTAYQYLDAAKVASAIADNPPANEAQAREMVPLLRQDEQQAVEVWRELRERHGDRLTAAVVREAVSSRLSSNGALAVHFSSESAEWLTPEHIIDRVVGLFGQIDLDPCSNGEGPNVPALQHLSEDGLAVTWHGRVYMNPPYGRVIGDWVSKLVAEHGAGRIAEAVALVPARTDTEWFGQFRDGAVCFIRGRLKFSNHDNSAPFPSAAVYLGDRLPEFVATFSDIGDVWTRVTD